MADSITALWKQMDFPQSSLYQKRVPKKLFIENPKFPASEKKLFQQNIKNIYWVYSLKPSSCGVLSYKDEICEYSEIAILQIELAHIKGIERLAEIIHRLIPYPLLLGFYIAKTDYIALSLAPKRFHQQEKDAIVAERFFTTQWMAHNSLNVSEADFMASLRWHNISLQDYKSLYNAWIERFIAYECSLRTAIFTLKNTEGRQEKLQKCHQIELKIAELRRQLKGAAFNEQVMLNTKIKQYEQILKQLSSDL